MNGTKIILISIIALVILSVSTAVIITLKPHMHKTIQLESIIYKRAK